MNFHVQRQIRQNRSEKLIVSIYVDDGLIAGSTQVAVDSFLRSLASEFEIVMSSLDSFLGIQIEQCESVRRIRVTTTSNRTRQLMVLSTAPLRISCPNIAYAVSKVARSMAEPTIFDRISGKRIFRYLPNVSTEIHQTTIIPKTGHDTVIDKHLASGWSKKVNGASGASARFVEYLPKTPAVRLPHGHGIDVSGAFTFRQRTVVSLLGLFELSTRSGERPEGRSELAAAQLAVKHINTRKLLPGYTLELLTNDTQTLTDWKKRLLNLMGRSAVEGNPSVREFGIPSDSIIVPATSINASSLPTEIMNTDIVMPDMPMVNAPEEMYGESAMQTTHANKSKSASRNQDVLPNKLKE
ncbi:metabotropic GABA-B receptor subtype 3, partial [Carabus blaptoides fortunei]